jgi:hypothetical protein
MTERQLKVRLGVALIASHFGIFILILILFAAGGFKFEDVTTMVAIIVPMFAGYSTSVTTFIVNDRHNIEDKSAPVNAVYARMSFVFPLAFTAIITAAITAQSLGAVFRDFEQFKQALVLIEATFAIYVARFVYSMFERPKSPTPRPRR